MKTLQSLIIRTFILSFVFWIVLYFGFVIINANLNLLEWEFIQRGNFAGFIIFFFVLSFIFNIISDNNNS